MPLKCSNNALCFCLTKMPGKNASIVYKSLAYKPLIKLQIFELRRGGGKIWKIEKSWLRPLKPSVNKEIKLNFLRLIRVNYLETVCYRFEMTLFQLTVMLTSTPSLLQVSWNSVKSLIFLSRRWMNPRCNRLVFAGSLICLCSTLCTWLRLMSKCTWLSKWD